MGDTGHSLIAHIKEQGIKWKRIPLIVKNVKNKAEEKSFVNEERRILLVSQEQEACTNAMPPRFHYRDEVSGMLKGTFAGDVARVPVWRI